MNVNLIIIAGNLTRDPQTKYTASQTAICEFGIAVNRKWKTQAGEAREEVLFVDCAAFGKTGELIGQHFTKGKPIFVQGRLKFDQWEDKNGGGKRSKLSVVVDNFQFVGSRDDGGEQQAPPQRSMPSMRKPNNTPATAPFPESGGVPEDEIPF